MVCSADGFTTISSDNCEKEFILTSEPIGRKQEVNDAVVWGALSVGIGYHQTKELFSVLDIPTMGCNKFQKQEKIGEVCISSIFYHSVNNEIVFLLIKFVIATL